MTATVNNPNYQGSASGTFVINPTSSSISLNCSPSSVTFGGQTSCTATVPSADGTVTFYSPTMLTGQWWNGTSGSWYPSGGGNLPGAPVAITHDGFLNYNITEESWTGATAAPANVNLTYIYARWTGTFVSSIAGTYTIGVNSDDGANLYVNGTELVANLATGQGAAPNLTYTQSGTINLTAGAVNTIVVEYEQTQGGAGIQLLWTPPGASSPSLLGWSVVPVNASKQAAITGNILAPGSSAVSAVWSGDTSYTSGSASSTVTATASTATELYSTPNPSVYGQNVTFSSRIDTGGGGPTGNVTFSNGGTNIGSGAASLVSTTNLVPYSQQFTNYTWGGYCGPMTNVTPNTTDFKAPDGSQTATKILTPGTITCGSTPSVGALSSIPGGLTPGQTYTVSVWLRGANGGESVFFGLNDTYTTSVTLTQVWQRYTVTYSDIGPNDRGFELATWATNITYYFWGAQTELSSSVGPYILTDASPRAGYGGAATLTTRSLGVGVASIAAAYPGDASDAASGFTGFAQTVNKAPAIVLLGNMSQTYTGRCAYPHRFHHASEPGHYVERRSRYQRRPISGDGDGQRSELPGQRQRYLHHHRRR